MRPAHRSPNPFSSLKQIQDFQSVIQHKDSLIQAKESNIQHLEDHIKNLELHPSLQDPNEYTTMRSSLKLLVEEIDEKDQHISKLKVSLNQASFQSQCALLQVQELQNQLLQSQREKNTFQKENDFLRGKQFQHFLSKKATQNKLKALEEDFERHREQIEILKKNEASLDSELRQTYEKMECLSKHSQMEQQNMKEKQALIQILSKNQQVLGREIKSKDADCESLRNLVNNYEWKEFCLETELSLAKKKLNQAHSFIDKIEAKAEHFQKENQQKSQNIFKIISQKELLEKEIVRLESQATVHQLKVDSLLLESQDYRKARQVLLQISQEKHELSAQISDLESEIKEWKNQAQFQVALAVDVERLMKMQQNQLKFEKDRCEGVLRKLQEKETCIANLSQYINARIAELHFCSNQISSLAKQLEDLKAQREKAETKNYEYEQQLEESQASKEMQEAKINEVIEINRQLIQKMQNDQLLALMFNRERQVRIKNLESLLIQKNQKVNELSIQIIEKDIAINKSIEDHQIKCFELSRAKSNLKNAILMNFQQESSLKSSSIDLHLAQLKFKEDEKTIYLLKASLLEKDKNDERLQIELTAQRLEKERLDKESKELKVEAVKLGLKLEESERDEIELKSRVEQKMKRIQNLELELDETKDQLEMVDFERQNEKKENKHLLESLGKARNQFEGFQKMSVESLNEIKALLIKQDVEETEVFILMEDEPNEDFEILQTRAEKYRKTILEKVSKFQQTLHPDYKCLALQA